MVWAAGSVELVSACAVRHSETNTMRKLALIPIVALWIGVSCGSGSGQGACSPPIVTPERVNTCGGAGQFQTFAKAINSCGCRVTVTIHLEGGGIDTLQVDPYQTQRKMIGLCGYTEQKFRADHKF